MACGSLNVAIKVLHILRDLGLHMPLLLGIFPWDDFLTHIIRDAKTQLLSPLPHKLPWAQQAVLKICRPQEGCRKGLLPVPPLPLFSPDLLSLVLTIPSHWALQPFLGTSKFACQNPHTCSFWRRYKEIWNWLRSLFRNTKSHLKNKAININKKTSTC